MKQAFSDRLSVPQTFQYRAVRKPDREFRKRDKHGAKAGGFCGNRINQPAQSVYHAQHNGGIEEHGVEPRCDTRQGKAKEHPLWRCNGELSRSRRPAWLRIHHFVSEATFACSPAVGTLRPMSSK